MTEDNWQDREMMCICNSLLYKLKKKTENKKHEILHEEDGKLWILGEVPLLATSVLFCSYRKF